MNNAGDYSLCDLAITTPLSGVALTPLRNLEGMLAATFEARLSYGSGGTTCRAYVQSSLDDGISWIDVACFAFTTASATKVVNLSGLAQTLILFTASDGTLTDDTAVDGVFGSAMRVKLVTTGIYANTVLSVKISAR